MNRARVGPIASRACRRTLSNPLLWGIVVLTAFASLAVNPAAMIATGDTSVGGLRPFSNSVFALSQVLALTGLLFYAFPVALLAGGAIHEDDDARVGDMLHSTPLTPGEYVVGTFAGVVGACAVVIALHLAFALAWYQFGPLVGSDAVLGPFTLASYLVPAGLFLVPGVLFVASLALAVGERFRNSMAVYAVAAGVALSTLTGLVPRPPSRADVVLDPFFAWGDVWGARWLSHAVFESDRGVAFYNNAALPIDAAFGLQRLAMAAATVILLWATVRHCARVVRGREAARRAARGGCKLRRPGARQPASAAPASAAMGSAHVHAAGLPVAARCAPRIVTATWPILLAEIRHLRAQPALYAFVAFAMALVIDHAGAARGVFDSPVIHTAGGLAVGLVEVVTALGCLLALFQAVEALDRPRRSRVEALLHATPTPTSAFLAGAMLSAALPVLVLLVACGAVACGVLWAQGTAPVQVWPFVLVWGGLLAPTFLVWICGVAVIQVISNNRQVTYLCGLLLLVGTLVATMTGAQTWTTNWALWGALRWTDIGTFELDRAVLAWNRVSMVAIAAGCAVAARARFRRTDPDPFSTARATGRRRRRQAALAGLLALVALAPTVIVALLVERGVGGRIARADEREYWRRNVATWKDVEPPTLTHVDVTVDLAPDEGRMAVTGAYTLRNDAGAPVERLPFTVGRGFRDVGWTVEGREFGVDARSGLHVLKLDRPLPPAGTATVGFSYHAAVPAGASRNGGGASEFILPSAVVLGTIGIDFLPVPGFVDGIGIDESNRAEDAAADAEAWRRELPPIAGPAAAFTSRMVVKAPSGFTVNGVGEKVSESTSRGITTVEWASDHPVRYLNLVGGRWRSVSRGDVDVFHHPSHHYNVDEMLAALAAAKARYSEWFHPYPWKSLRLSEYPDHATRAQGFPTNIPFSEGIGFLTRSEGGASLPTIVTAHEVAHQWWAHMLMPGRAPGADVLLEGMAHYATMLFLEAEHGPQARIAFATRLESRYVDRRRIDGEAALFEVTGTRAADETVIYDKGAWVLWMLHRHVGSDRMLEGLRSFIKRFAPSRDHPTLHDLIEVLRGCAESPSAFQGFVDQWFGAVVLPEFQVRDVTSEPDGDGWRVRAVVENVGSGSAVVDVVVSQGDRRPGPDSEVAAGRKARATLRLEPGIPTSVQWRTDFAPDLLVVDPEVNVLQMHRDRAAARVPRLDSSAIPSVEAAGGTARVRQCN